jgi:2-dehydropantoate 2-reductase
MDGPIALEASSDPRGGELAAALRRAGLPVETPRDIAPDQWTKLLVNLNNAVSALSGAPTQRLLRDPGYRRLVAAVIDEGLGVLRAAGIRPAKLRGVPVEWMPRILRMPTPIVRLVTRAQARVDPEARSSMWEDLEKRRPTEVDYLNGEIVALADRAGIDAPLNRRIVDLVRDAERAGAGSPQLLAEQLWSALTRADESASQK